MAACLLFVFGALIEYSAVNVMYRKDKLTQDKLEAEQKRRERMLQMRNNFHDQQNHGECADYSDTEKMFMESTDHEVNLYMYVLNHINCCIWTSFSCKPKDVLGSINQAKSILCHQVLSY